MPTHCCNYHHSFSSLIRLLAATSTNDSDNNHQRPPRHDDCDYDHNYHSTATSYYASTTTTTTATTNPATCLLLPLLPLALLLHSAPTPAHLRPPLHPPLLYSLTILTTLTKLISLGPLMTATTCCRLALTPLHNRKPK